MYPGAQALEERVKEIVTTRATAMAVVRKTTLDQIAETAAADASDAQAQLADPALPTKYDFDLAELSLLGRLQGLLPNANLATIADATKLGDDVVLARAMAVQDAAAFNLWASTAMIGTAYVKDLAADKIRSGIIQAGVAIVAGGAQIDDTGLDLLEYAGGFTAPSSDVASKVTPRGASPWAALGFHRVATVRRGLHVRADGTTGAERGYHRFEAVEEGNPGSTRSARLEIAGGDAGLDGQVRAYPLLVAERDMIVNRDGTVTGVFSVGGNSGFSGEVRVRATGTFITLGTSRFEAGSSWGDSTGVVNAQIQPSGDATLNNTTVNGILTTQRLNGVNIPSTSVAASGGVYTFAHGLGAAPKTLILQFSTTAGIWVPFVSAVSSWLVSCNATNVTITNQAAAARNVRGVVML